MEQVKSLNLADVQDYYTSIRPGTASVDMLTMDGTIHENINIFEDDVVNDSVLKLTVQSMGWWMSDREYTDVYLVIYDKDGSNTGTARSLTKQDKALVRYLEMTNYLGYPGSELSQYSGYLAAITRKMPASARQPVDSEGHHYGFSGKVHDLFTKLIKENTVIINPFASETTDMAFTRIKPPKKFESDFVFEPTWDAELTACAKLLQQGYGTSAELQWYLGDRLDLTQCTIDICKAVYVTNSGKTLVLGGGTLDDQRSPRIEYNFNNAYQMAEFAAKLLGTVRSDMSFESFVRDCVHKANYGAYRQMDEVTSIQMRA